MKRRSKMEQARLDAAATALEHGPLVPACDDAAETTGFTRGSRFLRLLSDIGTPIAGRRLVDLGTGYGSLAIAAAAAGAEVTAVDANPARLRVVRERARELGLALELREANLFELPWDREGADIAFLIGVVEYAGLWEQQRSVGDAQRLILRAAYRELRPGGRLVFGSKNRLWPRFAVADVHTGQPLVNALPRSLADLLSQQLNGRPYRHHIHSPDKWQQLIRDVGFRTTQLYFPYFSYQFPVLLSQRLDWQAIRTIQAFDLEEPEASVSLGRHWLAKSIIMALSGGLRLPVSHSVLIVAEK